MGKGGQFSWYSELLKDTTGAVLEKIHQLNKHRLAQGATQGVWRNENRKRCKILGFRRLAHLFPVQTKNEQRLYEVADATGGATVVYKA